MTKVYPIVFGTDENYAKYLSVTIQSIIENSNMEFYYELYVLYESLNEDDIKRIKQQEQKNIKIEFVNISSYLEGKDTLLADNVGHYSKAMYYRLLMPEIFDKYSKVLYLDCDLIVNCDVAEIFQIDLKDNYAAAVHDIGMLCKTTKWNSYAKKLTVKPEKYFNSGMLLINNEKFGKADLLKQANEILKKLCKLCFPDQDILNILLKDKVLLLDYSYNFQWYYYLMRNVYTEFFDNILYQNYLQSNNNFKILHFTSAIKPWTNPEIFESCYFWKYARNTAFYEEIFTSYLLTKIDARKKYTKFQIYRYKLKSLIPSKKQEYYIKKYSLIKKELGV